MAEVAVRTNNTNAQQLFNAGLTQCYVLLANNLDLATYLATAKTFFTVLISDDFDKDAITIYQADGIATISAFAALVAGTADTLTVGEIVFTAQATSAVLGEATFQSATSNEATASSLATQINAHNGTKNLVIATAVGAVLTIKAKNSGSAGNNIVLAYNSNGSVGLVLSGITAGKLDGGAGLFVGTWNGVVGVSSDNLAFLEAQAVITKRTAFFGNATNGAKSMFFAFGKLLAGATWRNQQYVEILV